MAATPGPSNTLLTATAAQVGVVRGLPALLGVAFGMAVLMFAVSIGLGALILATPAILLTLHWAGAVVLLWLAMQIAFSPASVKSVPTSARRIGFFGAAAFQWVNPKSWLASAGAAAFLNPSSAISPAVQASALALLFAAVALPSCFAWLAFGAAIKSLLRSARAQRVFNLAMAALLGASALALFFT